MTPVGATSGTPGARMGDHIATPTTQSLDDSAGAAFGAASGPGDPMSDMGSVRSLGDMAWCDAATKPSRSGTHKWFTTSFRSG